MRIKISGEHSLAICPQTKQTKFNLKQQQSTITKNNGEQWKRMVQTIAYT
jgi:hypothetical protein